MIGWAPKHVRKPPDAHRYTLIGTQRILEGLYARPGGMPRHASPEAKAAIISAQVSQGL